MFGKRRKGFRGLLKGLYCFKTPDGGTEGGGAGGQGTGSESSQGGTDGKGGSEDNFDTHAAMSELHKRGHVAMTQAAMNNLVKQRIADERERFKKEYGDPDAYKSLQEENASLKQQFEQLKAGKGGNSSGTNEDVISKADHEKIVKDLKTKYDELSTDHTGMKSEIVKAEIKKALLQNGALPESVDDVTELMSSSVSLETVDGKRDFFVLDKDGIKRHGTSGLLSVSDYAKEFLESKSWFKASTGGSGAGSGSSDTGASSGSKTVAELSKMSDAEYFAEKDRLGLRGSGSRAK
jgi:hypothetical protein